MNMLKTKYLVCCLISIASWDTIIQTMEAPASAGGGSGASASAGRRTSKRKAAAIAEDKVAAVPDKKINLARVPLTIDVKLLTADEPAVFDDADLASFKAIADLEAARRERRKETKAAWNRENAAHVKAVRQAWQKANAGRVKETNKAWKDAHPDSVKASKKKYRDAQKAKNAGL